MSVFSLVFPLATGPMVHPVDSLLVPVVELSPTSQALCLFLDSCAGDERICKIVACGARSAQYEACESVSIRMGLVNTRSVTNMTFALKDFQSEGLQIGYWHIHLRKQMYKSGF
ncbi:hypothetical protein CHARACLAT_011988 [Characodon lateralis]|uniref:Uncharacterized protein n=1 Tax=Characodon lateralis TaxID=208331 RepID=A0ABU7DFU5_9TELE|nr:hypothetical protein [Characodon lateralis]